MVTQRIVIMAMLITLSVLPGCSVNRVLNGPPPLEVEKVKVGESRQTIISVFGEPKSSEVKQDGRNDVYEFVSGYPGPKYFLSLLYITGDVLTFGLAEFLFNSNEKDKGGGTSGRAVVEYSKDDLAKSVLITKTNGQPWFYVEPPPEHMLAKLPPPRLEPTRVMPADGRIALVVQGDVKPELEIPESSAFSAAGKGASSGAVIGASAGVICYYGIFLCAPVFGAAGAIIGSLTGPAVMEPSSTWTAANEAYSSIIKKTDAKAEFSSNLVKLAEQRGYNVFLHADDLTHGRKEETRYREFAKAGVSSIIEIDSLAVSLEPVKRIPLEIKTLRQVSSRAHVKLIDTANSKIQHEMDIVDDSGPSRSIEEWMVDDARLLRSEITLAMPRLANFVFLEIFELQPIERRSLTGGFYDFVFDGLKPIYPEFKSNFQRDLRDLPETSLDPVLRWETFPGENVTYDLRIWRAANHYSVLNISNGEMVCNKENLIEPSYKVEPPLEASNTYVWSVRAHFDVDGIRRVSQWSRMSIKVSTVSKILSYGVMAIVPDMMTDKYYMFKARSGNQF